uniref:basic proline-rich protein-like n=1 Tax=Arvicanthis niloticus TaxID=61156 RepID=UPI0014870922|nr:basic proline-rich protein-like [Arvicanthis niloticus]
MSLKLEAMASAVELLCWAIRFPESTTAVRRPDHAGLASSRRPPAVAPPLISPQAPAGADPGSIAGPPHRETGDPGPGTAQQHQHLATRRHLRPWPQAEHRDPRPPAVPPPPPRRRPRQHPQAGASLGGSQLAGAHHRGSPARRRGRDGGAGRCARSAPSPLPAGWQGWRMLARCTPSLSSWARSSACHPRLGYGSHRSPVLAPLAQAWIPKDKF